jgi:serine protease Do
MNPVRILTWITIATLALFLSAAAYSRELPDFTELVEKNAEAVVNISTTLKVSGASRIPPGYNFPEIPQDSPFYEFFKKFFGELPEGEPSPFENRSSLGSGFIISSDGFVITNYHVVKDAEEIIVRLADRREYVAEIVGTDERSDLAVLKIDGENLPAVKLGDSSKLKVGEWVLAIGSPFGFDHSVTAGIVSAIGRSLPNENYIPFIQTDVAINPGNSGGPLFNLDGEVVGVNSQIYSRTGGFMGLSFAVPINVVTRVYQQLKEQGFVARGWLGVLIQDVTRELAESFGMKKPQGALIAKVLPDSPADKAGLEVGDVIIRFAGKEIGFSSELPPMVGSAEVGKAVPVEVIRNGEKKTIQVTIAQLPEEDQTIAGIQKPGAWAGDNPLGIAVSDLGREQRDKLELPDYGVMVEQVYEGPAQAAGVRKGDVILLFNNVKVRDVAHFKELLSGLPKDRPVPVLVQRRGGPIFLAIRIEEKPKG